MCFWHFCPSRHSVLSYILFRGRPSPTIHTIHTHAFLNMHQYVELVTGVILLAVVDVCTLAHYVTELSWNLKALYNFSTMFTPLQTRNHCMGWSRFAVLSHHRIGVSSYGCSKSASCCVRLQSHHQPQWRWEKSHPKFEIIEIVPLNVEAWNPFQNSF